MGLVLVAILTVASAGLPIAIAWVGKLIVDAVVFAHNAPAGAPKEAAYALVVRWVLVELGIVIGLGLVERCIGVMRQMVGSESAD